MKEAHISYIIQDLINKRPQTIIVETLDIKEMKEKYNKEKKNIEKCDSKEKLIQKECKKILLPSF